MDVDIQVDSHDNKNRAMSIKDGKKEKTSLVCKRVILISR